MKESAIPRAVGAPNPDNAGPMIAKVRIFEIDGGTMSLLAELDSSATSFRCRRVQKLRSYRYAIFSGGTDGRVSPPSYLTVF